MAIYHAPLHRHTKFRPFPTLDRRAMPDLLLVCPRLQPHPHYPPRAPPAGADVAAILLVNLF